MRLEEEKEDAEHEKKNEPGGAIKRAPLPISTSSSWLGSRAGRGAGHGAGRAAGRGRVAGRATGQRRKQKQ